MFKNFLDIIKPGKTLSPFTNLHLVWCSYYCKHIYIYMILQCKYSCHIEFSNKDVLFFDHVKHENNGS